jgi:hypothetical protein
MFKDSYSYFSEISIKAAPLFEGALTCRKYIPFIGWTLKDELYWNVFTIFLSEQDIFTFFRFVRTGSRNRNLEIVPQLLKTNKRT